MYWYCVLDIIITLYYIILKGLLGGIEELNKGGELKMEMDTRMGYATTSVLEQMTKDYIIAHIDIKGQYVGKVEYLNKYSALKEYNKR